MKLFKQSSTSNQVNQPKASIVRVFDREGVTFRAIAPASWDTRDPALFGVDWEIAAFLLQLEDEGLVQVREDGIFLPWLSAYRIKESCDPTEYSLLGLPPDSPWRPVLTSKGGLTDPGFTIFLDWKAPNGRRPPGNTSAEGAVLKVGSEQYLLSRAAWEMVEAVRRFFDVPRPSGSDPDTNRRAWAEIRSKAIAAGAELSHFLAKTIVLTPERLDIQLRKADRSAGNVIEVVPGFKEQPPRWLEFFDRFQDVRERYEIPDGEGMTHVMITPEVRTVLREIKRMPGRRVAGRRAEAFVRNPFATLDPDASKVIDPAQFEQALDKAGIGNTTFRAHVRRDERGYPFETGLLIEERVGWEIRNDLVLFEGSETLERFLYRLESSIRNGHLYCHWEGYDLEIVGDTSYQAETLRKALEEIRSGGRPCANEIFDLSRYAQRIEGFGEDKPYYSPFIARKSSEEGWFPENVEFGIFYTPDEGGEPFAISLANPMDFRNALQKAKSEGRDAFDFPGCPKAIPVNWAEEIVATLDKAAAAVEHGRFDPADISGKQRVARRISLVIKPNVETLDYEERRGTLNEPEQTFSLPKSLKPNTALKEHQKKGVAWLLTRWAQSPHECRGTLLADDMGLGKTLQILTFLACLLERTPNVAPFLVVAPVSLLENWLEEIDRFFMPGTFEVLTLYGSTLTQKRVTRDELDAALIKQGIDRILHRDWRGAANLVLTTYETLRDLEFSLAAEKWSVMVCDEAQKIKNPNALVTRAAKKQNARFRIACTGTPVENTLTDLWCLFDFIQPGLLGSLKHFGERYRKPIEAETDEDKARVEELRRIIEPQTLRRTKQEVARDLPNKIEVSECRELPLSDRQRALYAEAIRAFRNQSGSEANAHLGLLHYLRRVCCVPVPPGMLATDATAMTESERHSPKMAWLLKTLATIQQRGEKAIVFCEVKDFQRVLQRAVTERFGFVPDIINGNTIASARSANSRQKRIKAFQERPGFGVIILSPLATGFGLNIQAANHVIHFTRSWNPAKEDQATDRAYRLGQSRDVYVYYPIVVAEDFLTFDAKLDKLLAWKRGLSADMLNGTSEVGLSDFADLEAPDGGNAFGDQFITPDDLVSLDANAFERFCAILWCKMGYRRTIHTPKSGDGGVDVVAIKGNEGMLIQCKSSTRDRELGWEAVKDVVAGAANYRTQYPEVIFSLVAVTNRRFNATARAQAAANRVELIDIDGLSKKLAEYPVRMSELALHHG